MKILSQGMRIKFKINFYGSTKIFTRKIHSIYECKYNDVIRYNTRGINGGYGCNGFSVEPKDIIKVY